MSKGMELLASEAFLHSIPSQSDSEGFGVICYLRIYDGQARWLEISSR